MDDRKSKERIRISKPIATVIEISIHRQEDNPIFGEGNIRLRLEDEGAGGFFVLSQQGKDCIQINPDEIMLIADECRKMMENYETPHLPVM